MTVNAWKTDDWKDWNNGNIFTIFLTNYERNNLLDFNRIIHKGWDFKDDCTEFILFVFFIFTIAYNFKIVCFFSNLLKDHPLWVNLYIICLSLFPSVCMQWTAKPISPNFLRQLTVTPGKVELKNLARTKYELFIWESTN